MNNESSSRLLADIGGTNARFAWQTHRDAALTDVASYPCVEHESLEAAIRHYLTQHHKACPPDCAIGIANPILGDLVQMTNHHWSFSVSQLQRNLGLTRLKVINDFSALALSLPVLQDADLHAIGGGVAVIGAPKAVLGPGTGLGVSGLLPSGANQFVAVTGEGGHVTLAPDNDFEVAVVGWLTRRFGHASAERALSGPGLINLYEAACALTPQPALPLSAADIIARARSAEDAPCVAAVQLFCAFLGSVAGNLGLTLGARGGVYIGGGIAPRMRGELERSTFRERFVAKGRFRGYLSAIPTYVIDAKLSPALAGAARALD
jgi:glucokinase